MNTYTNTNTGAGSVPVAQRELQIPNALDVLQNEVDRASKDVEELYARLQKVCAPDAPTPENPSAEKVMTTAEYVENLRKKAAQVNRICQSLESILQRLEL